MQDFVNIAKRSSVIINVFNLSYIFLNHAHHRKLCTLFRVRVFLTPRLLLKKFESVIIIFSLNFLFLTPFYLSGIFTNLRFLYEVLLISVLIKLIQFLLFSSNFSKQHTTHIPTHSIDLSGTVIEIKKCTSVFMHIEVIFVVLSEF